MTDETKWAQTHKAAMKRCEERAAARNVAESPRVFLPTCVFVGDVVQYEVLESIDERILRRREVVEAHCYGERFAYPTVTLSMAEVGEPAPMPTKSAGGRIGVVAALFARLLRDESGAHVVIHCSDAEMLRWRDEFVDRGVQFEAVGVKVKWLKPTGTSEHTLFVDLPHVLRVSFPLGSLLEIKRGA